MTHHPSSVNLHQNEVNGTLFFSNRKNGTLFLKNLLMKVVFKLMFYYALMNMIFSKLFNIIIKVKCVYFFIV